MQTMTLPNVSAALAVASGFLATGYRACKVRPNGFVLVSTGGSLLAIKIGA